MRIILKIAKNELRHLFYSPIAWFLGIIMLVLSAVFYTNYMYMISKLVAMMSKNQPEFKHYAVESVTSMFFSNPNGGYFATLLSQLYLFVPLLTMGVINKEFNNGTIKLLYSSPVKLRQIVLGKYLAMVAYCLMLVAVCGIFIIVGFTDIKSLDYPPLLTASLGIFLLLSALTAVGFFMSSLTSYQIVSAIASFTLFFILFRIGGLWQQYEFVRDLTWFLSVGGRTANMITGLIASKDILYYLVIIFMFVGFTYLKMQDGLETRKWHAKAGRYISIVVIGLTIGYLGSRPATTWYVDTTAQQLRTVHPRTQKILQQLNDGPLEITFYVNLFHGAISGGAPAARNVYITSLWEGYQRFKTDIDFRYVYYYAVRENDSMIYKT
ncbi:MAG: ABC transporter permease subunit, partial [Pseudobacter sp.]|uniref:ABC transporter permease n=1 Tax=Pseudobacter sp. TaxID=2045420 RepID=UPI003F8167E1